MSRDPELPKFDTFESRLHRPGGTEFTPEEVERGKADYREMVLNGTSSKDVSTPQLDHQWGTAPYLSRTTPDIQVCKLCGVVRRRDGVENGPCKGKQVIALRSGEVGK